MTGFPMAYDEIHPCLSLWRVAFVPQPGMQKRPLPPEEMGEKLVNSCLSTIQGAVVFCRKKESIVRYVVSGIVILAGGAITLLVIENGALLLMSVQFSILGKHLPMVPLGLLLLLSCLFGAALVYIVTLITAWQERHELRELRKKLVELEQVSNPPIPQQYSPLVYVPMPGLSSDVFAAPPQQYPPA
jgi:uncharacterized integral membrane protein